MLGVTKGTTGAWSVNRRSACAHRAAAVGDPVDSAASAWWTMASNRGSQKGHGAVLAVSGKELWQLLYSGPRNSDAAG